MKLILAPLFIFMALTPVEDSRAEYDPREDVLVRAHSVKKSYIDELPRYCLHLMTEEQYLHLDRISPELKHWIINRIQELMSAKGFFETANHQCDLEIGYEIKVKNQVLLHSPRFAHINVGGTIAERLDLIPERTLVIHAHDLHMDRTLWVGTAEEIVFNMKSDAQDLEAIESRLDYAFSEMSKTFPKCNCKKN